jgi:hypothetical protein
LYPYNGGVIQPLHLYCPLGRREMKGNEGLQRKDSNHGKRSKDFRRASRNGTRGVFPSARKTSFVPVRLRSEISSRSGQYGGHSGKRLRDCPQMESGVMSNLPSRTDLFKEYPGPIRSSGYAQASKDSIREEKEEKQLPLICVKGGGWKC